MHLFLLQLMQQYHNEELPSSFRIPASESFPSRPPRQTPSLPGCRLPRSGPSRRSCMGMATSTSRSRMSRNGICAVHCNLQRRIGNRPRRGTKVDQGCLNVEPVLDCRELFKCRRYHTKSKCRLACHSSGQNPDQKRTKPMHSPPERCWHGVAVSSNCTVPTLNETVSQGARPRTEGRGAELVGPVLGGEYTSAVRAAGGRARRDCRGGLCGSEARRQRRVGLPGPARAARCSSAQWRPHPTPSRQGKRRGR